MSERIDPMQALTRMNANAPRLAKAKAERVYMEEYRKSLKALLMKSSGVESIGAQEREAYSHKDYLAHLEALKTAVQGEEVLRWRMVTDQASIEVWRSQEASNRSMDRSAA
jgi:hypothetical protein